MRRRLTYANVASTLALILAMSGTAYAVATVSSADIVNKTIQFKDVSNAAAFALLPNTHIGVKDDAGVISGTDAQTIGVLDIAKAGNFVVFAKLWLRNDGGAPVTMFCSLLGGVAFDLNHTALAAAGSPGSTESMSFIVAEFFDQGEIARVTCNPQGGTVHVFDLKMVAVEAGGATEEPL